MRLYIVILIRSDSYSIMIQHACSPLKSHFYIIEKREKQSLVHFYGGGTGCRRVNKEQLLETMYHLMEGLKKGLLSAAILFSISVN